MSSSESRDALSPVSFPIGQFSRGVLTLRIKLCKLVVIGKFRSLAVGVELSRSLRFVC